jgi:Domain of unknown function (DUF4062)
MKIFLSSTILDLRDLRDALVTGLTADGHQIIASEKGTLQIEPGKHSYEQCLKSASECDCLVAVIDGRFGGEYPQKGSNKSITEAEIEAVMAQDKKTLVFVRQSVWDALATQKAAIFSGKANEHWIVKNIVEEPEVFGLIDRIKRKPQNNWIFQFNYPTDLLAQIRAQIGSSRNATDWLDQETGSIYTTKKTLANPTATALTPFQYRQLNARRDALLPEWELRSEKVKRLRLELGIQTGTAVKFQLEQQLLVEEGKLLELEVELEEIDRKLIQ